MKTAKIFSGYNTGVSQKNSEPKAITKKIANWRKLIWPLPTEATLRTMWAWILPILGSDVNLLLRFGHPSAGMEPAALRRRSSVCGCRELVQSFNLKDSIQQAKQAPDAIQ